MDGRGIGKWKGWDRQMGGEDRQMGQGGSQTEGRRIGKWGSY